MFAVRLCFFFSREFFSHEGTKPRRGRGSLGVLISWSGLTDSGGFASEFMCLEVCYSIIQKRLQQNL